MADTTTTATAYTVIKAFVYAGRAYPRGATWAPAGHRADAGIIRGRFVIAADALPARRAERPRGRRTP